MALLDRDEMRVKLYGAKKAEGILESKLMKSLTDAVPVEEEAAVMMDHDYDGIRELDNNLPPWWKYGFYLTIVVAIVYLFNFHVLHTGKLSLEEYSQEMKDGDAAVAEYQKTAVDLVDEKTVKLLTDATSLTAGKAIFKQNCVVCHGEFGEGKEGLGPNFTDDYWLHGGSVNDVFRSVKYGWTEKGMKSWQQDLKPSEIQLVVSYVKSLRGTNPPNPKEKQGELYIENGAKPLGDSAASGNDSLPKPANDSVKK
jgi:cytochrome c oxidase cbb3-type subunit III